MGRYLSRASVAVPASRASGRRREAPDEDLFTLAVLAADGVDGGRGDRAIRRVHLFGDFTPEQVELIGTAVGGEVAEAVAHPDREELLRELVAEEGGNPSPGALLILAGEGGRDRPTPPGPLRDSAAIALVLEPSAEAPTSTDALGDGSRLDLERLGLEIGGPGSALALAAEWAEQLPASVNVPPAVDAAWEVGHAPPAPELAVVSEGAYVPRPRYLENLPSRWRFAADRCPACGTTTFPVRGFCRQCGATSGLERFELPLQGGTVAAVTTVHPGAQPTEFDWRVDRQGAYDVALVELAPGIRVTLQATDAPAGAFRPGDRVGTRLRRLYPMEGEWRYGRKAVPLSPPTP